MSKLAAMADVCVKVPRTENHMIKKLYLPIYHCWYLELEMYFFNGNDGARGPRLRGEITIYYRNFLVRKDLKCGIYENCSKGYWLCWIIYFHVVGAA